ncbi:DUF4395 family protein [Alkalibaculum sp. M08DMB]|uniref:DUF4395 family protein n=1 Tax=Alkalibaculum sporogenes TaxID=2655001 RepID=A0A6A7KBR1_9FIRM|nr:DUF4395 family protein [Alkalibaculum sporogenes]MPW26958.1 DUF4395 family protein [Alkalibaculum sporogenes]
MAGVKPVSISENAFDFCRYSVAVLVWVSFAFRQKEVLVVVFIILLLSAILKVKKAPMIVLYNHTLGRFYPGENVILDEKGIRFAHSVGAAMSGICLILLYSGLSTVGLIILFLLAVLKTSAAFGFCSALKLYTCMNSGTCCRVGKMARRIKHD